MTAGPEAAATAHDELMTIAARLTADGERPTPPCPEPVNAAMIRHWTEAIGDTDPAWETAAPPAMLQVWSMPGLGPKSGSVADEPLRLLDAAGYTGVVATNCEQTYDRYLRLGERLRSTMRFGGITGPKRTALGEGYFVTWHQTWYAGAERVGEMLFRVLKFRPRGRATSRAAPGAARPADAGPLRPAIGQDTRFFWAGTRAGQLRIQRCRACGALRHPPGPMCPRCHAIERDHITAAGRGTVYSYVVHHHPPVPGREPPFVVALVELEEGVRMVGNVVGCEPADVRIGLPVQVTFERVDDDLTLPQWAPAWNDRVITSAGAAPAAEAPADGRPGLRIELTPTFVIATALATRDFTPVHHNTELARAQGSKEIFLNILTTMGLVQRYVTETVPGATLAGISVRLGVPAYAGDTLTLTGRRRDATTMEVRGAVRLGDHVIATVTHQEQA